MHKTVLTSCVVGVAVLLAACSRPEAQETLPTATPMPTAVVPTTTPTGIPAPTVTPFPTATPGGEVLLLTGTTTPLAEGATPEPEAGAATPTPNTAPEDEALANLDLGAVVFSADFSAGWPSTDAATVKIRLDRGQHLFEVGPFDGAFVWTTAVSQADLFASIEANPAECTGRSGYGLAIRFKDLNNYYLFTVFCDNSYTIVAKVGGALSGVGVEPGQLPSGIDAGSAQTHTLAALARGETFTLYMDGQQVSSFSDSRLEAGDIAWYAVSQSDAVARIRFDNLEVKSLR